MTSYFLASFIFYLEYVCVFRRKNVLHLCIIQSSSLVSGIGTMSHGVGTPLHLRISLRVHELYWKPYSCLKFIGMIICYRNVVDEISTFRIWCLVLIANVISEIIEPNHWNKSFHTYISHDINILFLWPKIHRCCCYF